MSTVATGERLLTAEEYFELPDGPPSELVRGKVVEVVHPGSRHGKIQSRIVRLMGNFAAERKLADPLVESGFITKRDPYSVRGPDVMFYSWERMPKGQTPIGFSDIPPEIVFEVLSPSQRLRELLEKADEYLAAGVLCVCIVDPERRTVRVCEPEKAMTELTEADTLHLPVPLEEWRPTVGDFFPE